jgi:uncharacterized protein (DUF2267 family)
MSSTENLVEHVAAHAGTPTEHADMALRVVLFRIGSCLGPVQRQLLLEELPPTLRGSVGQGGDIALPVEERILAQGITLGRAHELVVSVFRVLAERLSRDLIDALEGVLPRELASLLVAGAEAQRGEVVSGLRDTLAEGRPGSKHPISEAVRVPR